MEPLASPETSVNYQAHTLHNNPEEVRPHLQRSERLKFPNIIVALRANSRVSTLK